MRCAAAVPRRSPLLRRRPKMMCRGSTNDAVVLRISADERLNEHERTVQPDAVRLRTGDPRGSGQKARQPGGFAELLACGRFDDSVVTSRRLFSDPGQAQNLSLDREEGVRWIAVIAGYFHGTPAHSARVVAVPVRKIVEAGCRSSKTPAMNQDRRSSHTPRPGGTDGREPPQAQAGRQSS